MSAESARQQDGAYAAPCEVRGPSLAPFRIVTGGDAVAPLPMGDLAERPVKFAPQRMGMIDRRRAQDLADLADLEAKRNRLLIEQDRILREIAEVDATLQFLERSVNNADALVDRG